MNDNRYRVLVTGSRNWTDETRIREAIGSIVMYHGPENVVIVHGACPTGADAIADQIVAGWTDLTAEPHPADWDRCTPACAARPDHRRRKVDGDTAHPGRLDTYCPYAGPRRNRAMAVLGADVCLAFPRGNSRGTENCIRAARAAGIPVRRYQGA